MSESIPPEFIIVGAAKSGTTSVHEYLGEHPGVFMTSPKETNYFYLQAGDRRSEFSWGDIPWDAEQQIDTPAKYLALFAAARPGQVRGEASPSYMSDPRIPRLVHAWNPSMRILMLLRDPAERAWSDFLHHLRDGTEPMPLERFRDAFADGERRAAENWGLHCVYDAKGRYGSCLEQWLAVFPREQVGVFFYDDLQRDPRAFMRALYTFIGVDPAFEPRLDTRYNITGVPRRRWLHHFIHRPHPLKRMLRWMFPRDFRRRLRYRLMQRNLDAPPPLPADIRHELAGHYLAEVEKLEALCGRDLGAWKPGARA